MNRQALAAVWCCFLLAAYVRAAEWDCASTTNTGTFTRSSDCAISGNDHVSITNTLEINGTATNNYGNLATITAATNKRHFYINNPSHKLILRYVNLVGGDVTVYSDVPANYGGSILISSSGGNLNLYFSSIHNNKAYVGGGLHIDGASNNLANVDISNTEFTFNIVTSTSGNCAGGGIYLTDNTNTKIIGSSFISNYINNSVVADDICSDGSPTISLINTYFKNNPNGNSNYIVTTCSDNINICTENQFTGSCTAVDNSNTKAGVQCDDVCLPGYEALNEIITSGKCINRIVSPTACEAAASGLRNHGSFGHIGYGGYGGYGSVNDRDDWTYGCTLHNRPDLHRFMFNTGEGEFVQTYAMCNSMINCVCANKICHKCLRGYYNPSDSNNTCIKCPAEKPTTLNEGSIQASDCIAHPLEWDCAVTSNTGNFTLGSNCTILGHSHVVVSDALQIVGTNKSDLSTVKPASGSRHFYVLSSGKLTLQNLKLVGSYVLGSIFNRGVFEASFCVFKDNRMAIHQIDGYPSVIIYSSHIINNGKGIYSWGGRGILKVYNSNISNNNEEGIYYGYIENVELYNTTIAHNQGHGITAYNDWQSHTLLLVNCIIKYNTELYITLNGGGGLHITGNMHVITQGTSFIGNYASSKQGHHIFAETGSNGCAPTFTIVNTHFSDPYSNESFYAYDPNNQNIKATWQNCSSKLCIERPVTGPCIAVNNTNEKLGVICNTRCAIGSYCDGENQYLCENGSYNNIKEQTSCKNCTAGKYSISGPGQTSENVCLNCDIGTYNDLEGQVACKNCGAGKFNDVEGQSNEFVACKNCTAGKYSISGPGQTSENICLNCISGKYSIAGPGQINENVCIECIAGKYSLSGESQTSENVCLNCAKGEFAEFEGATGCSTCDLGKYNDLEGQVTCKNCDIGKSSREEGQINCTLCAKGEFAEFEGATGCSTCDPGKYNDLEGQVTCKNCSKGKFNNGVGMIDESVCQECNIGKYNGIEGQVYETACIDCPSLTFNDQTAQGVCKSCIFNEGLVGIAVCCQSGLYLRNDQCFTCPQPQHCLGGITCTRNREGLACMKCMPRYYKANGECLRCPDSNMTFLIAIVFGVISVLYGIYQTLDAAVKPGTKDGSEENNKESEDETQAEHLENKKDQFKQNILSNDEEEASMENNASNIDDDDKKMNVFARARRLTGIIGILISHSMTLNITFPTLRLPHLPPWLLHLLQSILNILTIDISGAASSPECAWQFSTNDIYLSKIFVPLLLFVFFSCWYKVASVGFNRSFGFRFGNPQRVISVGTYIWINSLYAIVLLQVLSAFDCTTQADGSITFDSDPNVLCVSLFDNYYNLAAIIVVPLLLLSLYFIQKRCILNRGYCSKKSFHATVIILFFCSSVYSMYILYNAAGASTTNSFVAFTGLFVAFPLYGIGSTYLILHYVFDFHFTTKIKKMFQKPKWAEDISDDNYGKFGWIFDKFSDKFYFWEFVIVIRKLMVGCVAMFLTNRQEYALPMQVGLCLSYFIALLICQPFLLDRELKIKDPSKTGGDDKKRIRSTNNILDILLSGAELFILIAGYINYYILTSIETKEIDSGEVIKGNTQRKMMTHSPILNVISFGFEWIGTIILIIGFCFCMKEVAVVKVSKMREKTKKKKNSNNKERNLTKVAPTS